MRESKEKAERGLKDSKEEDEEGEKGTGDMYVKSSGMTADGGDFDATRPGAGREANREYHFLFDLSCSFFVR